MNCEILIKKIKILENRLKYYIDKYGVPKDWRTIEEELEFVNLDEFFEEGCEKIINKSSRENNEEEISEDEEKKNKINESAKMLLHLQLNDLIDILLEQIRNNNALYNSLISLKNKLIK